MGLPQPMLASIAASGTSVCSEPVYSAEPKTPLVSSGVPQQDASLTSVIESACAA